MASINKVMLLGNVTRELETTYTPKGTPKVLLGLAVNERWKDANGETREETTFVDCILWGKTGDTAARLVTKGTALFVEGRLKQEEWEDKKTGERRRKTRVVVDTWQFVGPKREGAGAGGSASARPPTRAAQRDTMDTVFTPDGAEEDDIPF